MSARIDLLRREVGRLGASAFLVLDSTNLRYLTGFESSNAALLVDRERALLLTDGRYVEAARKLDGVDVLQAERNLAGDLAARLPSLVQGPVAFEAGRVSYATYATLATSGVALVPTTGAVEGLRSRKEPQELAAIRRAAAIVSEAFELLLRERLVGRTEAEVAWWVERTMRELGAEGLAFEPIVAGGPNGALPHHRPGARPIGPGELVVVDAGCRVDGYCSDCTRTVATGALPDALASAYAACLEIQEAALAALAPGVACREVDAVQRAALAERGYAVYHSLGHAVGLEVHEEPRLAESSSAQVEPGNVLTVEPGIYLPGLGGVRIEDLVAVGEHAVEVLTPVTKQLVTVG